MLSRLKNYFLVALVVAAFYFLLSHHFIFSSFKDFDLLKKQELTLKYTFYSLRQHTVLDTLRIKELRDAGIETILLDRGMASEQRLDELLTEIDAAK
jgi:Tfp pilus assembly protein PilO